MNTLGIDPGLNGGLAYLVDGVPAEWLPTPRHGGKGSIDWREVHAWLQARGPIELACLERVHAMPGQGVSSTFRFGETYGGARALLEALQVPHELVTPRAWKAMLTGVDRSDKRSSGVWLKRRFPAIDLRVSTRARYPHDGVADAVCLGLHAHRLLNL
jgi:crossover junction endodeoxyribonuclease RuvC